MSPIATQQILKFLLTPARYSSCLHQRIPWAGTTLGFKGSAIADIAVNVRNFNANSTSEEGNNGSFNIEIEGKGGVRSVSRDLDAEEHIEREKFTQVIDVELPDFDVGNGKGTVVKYYKKEGDIISKGDKLCDIELEVSAKYKCVYFRLRVSIHYIYYRAVTLLACCRYRCSHLG